MFSGTVFAISSTLAAFAAVVSFAGPRSRCSWYSPTNESADTATTAAPRHQRELRSTVLNSSYHVVSSFCIGSPYSFAGDDLGTLAGWTRSSR